MGEAGGMKHSPTIWDRVGPGVERLNAMTREEAVGELESLSGSRAWSERVAEARPFESLDALIRASASAWEGMPREALLEAFSRHPRIGERNLEQAQFAADAETSRREQSGMAGATEEERRAFTTGNAEYEGKFGHVFLICATGKSGTEMLGELRLRLKNDADTELKNATRKQHEIVVIRLVRWLST